MTNDIKYKGNKIVTMAHSIQKTKKSEAFAIINRAVLSGAEPLTEYALANLYSFFLPAKTKKPKTSQAWIANAIADCDVRHYLNFAHVKDKELAATDGHRLHAMPTDLPDGYYDSAMNPVDVDGKYPDTERVLVQDRSKPILLDLSKTEIVHNAYKGKPDDVYLFNVGDKQLAFRTKHINEAVVLMENPMISFGTSTFITDGTHKAVVMPIRL
ncbi:hypothetical protein MNBD_GAMMA12-3921 [hydrothermal vent metagenome]|uniref:Uncharacterized protein n=1 Tax=hydrothermal vent metagenome TaxID=652676 RepID=A0A3B0YRB0_9ZZZZ